MANKIVSNRSPYGMQILGSNTTSILYWDFSNTEDFYWLDNSVSPSIFYQVSPLFAYQWFAANPTSNTGVTIAYNPFLGSFQNQMQKISDKV